MSVALPRTMKSTGGAQVWSKAGGGGKPPSMISYGPPTTPMSAEPCVRKVICGDHPQQLKLTASSLIPGVLHRASEGSRAEPLQHPARKLPSWSGHLCSEVLSYWFAVLCSFFIEQFGLEEKRRRRKEERSKDHLIPTPCHGRGYLPLWEKRR